MQHAQMTLCSPRQQTRPRRSARASAAPCPAGTTAGGSSRGSQSAQVASLQLLENNGVAGVAVSLQHSRSAVRMRASRVGPAPAQRPGARLDRSGWLAAAFAAGPRRAALRRRRRRRLPMHQGAWLTRHGRLNTTVPRAAASSMPCNILTLHGYVRRGVKGRAVGHGLPSRRRPAPARADARPALSGPAGTGWAVECNCTLRCSRARTQTSLAHTCPKFWRKPGAHPDRAESCHARAARPHRSGFRCRCRCHCRCRCRCRCRAVQSPRSWLLARRQEMAERHCG
jgi:hypothetical protein